MQKNVPAPGINPVARFSDVLLALVKMDFLLKALRRSYRASAELA